MPKRTTQDHRARIVGDASRENTIEIKPGLPLIHPNYGVVSGDSSSRTSNSLASGTFLDEFEEGESSSTERLEARAVAVLVSETFGDGLQYFDAGKFNIDTNFVQSGSSAEGFSLIFGAGKGRRRATKIGAGTLSLQLQRVLSLTQIV